MLGLCHGLLVYLDIYIRNPVSRNVCYLIPFFFLNCVSVICNFPFIFIFYSCFQNSQIQMSYFRTWILLICQAIAMMTFCLSLRTTETICIPPSLSLVHTCVAAQRGILTLLFHKRRKNSQLDPVVHSLLSSSQNCFCQLQRLRKWWEKQYRNLTKCSNLWVCRATRDKAAETVVQLLETPFVVHPLEREFCDKHSVKYLGKTISWQGKKRQQNGTVSNWRVSECPSNVCSSIYLKLYLPPPHLPSAPLRPQVCVGVIVLATHKKKNKNTYKAQKKHKSYSQVAKIGKTHRPVRRSQQFS